MKYQQLRRHLQQPRTRVFWNEPPLNTEAVYYHLLEEGIGETVAASRAERYPERYIYYIEEWGSSPEEAHASTMVELIGPPAALVSSTNDLIIEWDASWDSSRFEEEVHEVFQGWATWDPDPDAHVSEYSERLDRGETELPDVIDLMDEIRSYAAQYDVEPWTPDHDDIFIAPDGRTASQLGREIASADEWDELVEAIEAYKEQQQYWPNVWQEGERGGYTMVDTQTGDYGDYHPGPTWM